MTQSNGQRAAKAEDVLLERDVRAAAGLQLIGVSCLHHFASNQKALERGDSEGVHQSRVALRRLRASLSLFRGLLRDEESERVKAGLRWLTSALGPARDDDVFMEESLAPLLQAGEHGIELRRLEATIRHRRDERIGEAQGVAASERARGVLLQTALWLLGGDWLSAPERRPDRRQPLKSMARATLTERTKKLSKKLRRFERLDPHQRHKLRIAVKKLHYGTEFFTSLFPKRKRRRQRYLELLKELQDHLGQLNDIHTHEAMARELLSAPSVPEAGAVFAMGIVRGVEQARGEALDAAARKTGKRLAGAKPFWT